jgi:uncharacterized membrane protein
VSPRSIKAVLAFFLCVFAAIVYASPFLLSYGSVGGLDGTPGFIDHFDIWHNMNFISGAAYMSGDLMCNQEAARSFVLNGSQAPFCARDMAIIAGLAIGMLSAFAIDGRRYDRRLLNSFIATSFVLAIADWSVQHFLSINVFWSREITGLMVGAAVSLLIAIIIDRSQTQPGDRCR